MDNYGFVRLAAASPRVMLGNPKENVREILRLWAEADAQGALCVVFPELCLTGATCGDLFHMRDLENEALDALGALLAESINYRAAALVGLPLRVHGRLYNVSVLMCQGRLLCAAPRTPDRVQSRWFQFFDGNPRAVPCLRQQILFGVNTMPLGCVVMGIAFDVDALLALPRGGAQVLLMPAAMPAAVGEAGRMKEFLSQMAAIGHCALCYAGAGMGESSSEAVYAGDTLIFEKDMLLAEGGRFAREGQIVFADIDTDALTAERQITQAYGGYEETLAQSLTPPHYDVNKHFTRAIDPAPLFRDEPAFYEEALTMQAAAIIRRMEAVGTKKLVINISGGLDSTIAVLAACRAMKLLDLPASNITGIFLPGFGTGGGTGVRARRLLTALGVSAREIDIAPVCEMLLRDTGHDGMTTDIAYENVQARARTLIALNIANMENALELSTGDLSELALGWCTLGGDAVGMYNPNGGIPKTMLQGMARWYAAACGDEELRAVLLEVVGAPVSPELKKDEEGVPHATEDAVGPYALHDFFLYYYLTGGTTREKLLFLAEKAFGNQYDSSTIKKTLDIFTRRFVTQQYKRQALPEGPAVLDVSLSARGGWMMPGDIRR